MNYASDSAKLLLCLFFSLFTFTFSFAQWNPQTQSTTTSIYRSGKVGVGLSQNPSAELHVSQLNLSDGGLQYAPTFRLERSYSAATFTWDFLPENALEIEKNSTLALSINTDENKATAKKLILGHSASATSQTGEEMTFGYDDTFRGS
ncbi:MAG: hypothetical protein AB8F74_13805, partial [Saprospiraceae bacterium]